MHNRILIIIIIITKTILDIVRPPLKRAYNYIKKKALNVFKRKGPMPKVPQPCVLKVDTKVDIEKWINQARM